MMRKNKKKIFFMTNALIGLFNLLVYFSIRAMWSGIIRYTFNAMPYILLALLVGLVLLSGVLIIKQRYPLFISIPLMIYNLLLLGLDGYIISETTEATHYFIREFMYGLMFVGIIITITYIVSQIPKRRWFKSSFVPATLLIILFVGGIIWKFEIKLFNKFDSIPVVYAVEDTYQIVFTTKAKGEAWVEIDGVEYNDTFAGYRYTEETTHKITVPMEALDNAKEYTIYTRAMYLRGPYCSLQGETLSETYKWRGVNTADGLDYYVLSDTHNTQKTPLQAATYFEEKLDLLISAGDNVSWIDREEDLRNFHTLAGNITNGEIPVVYARGNHETKGVMAKDFHRYVGSVNGNYYYTFRINNIWGIVLDIGEDHADDFVEYAGISKFNSYRKEQTKFLDEIIQQKDNEYDAEGIDYRILVAHIPLTTKSKNDYVADIKDEWLERLNQMKLTVHFAGHFHELWYVDANLEEGSTLTQVKEFSGKESGNRIRIATNANFPTILVSKRGEEQSLLDEEKVFDTAFIGLAVSVQNNETIMRYTNDHKEVVGNIRSPWNSSIYYGNEIRIENVKQ